MRPRLRPEARAKPVGVSLPGPMLHSLDELVGLAPFGGRSEAIQAALMPFLADHASAKSPGGDQWAVLMVCFDEKDERRIAEVRHEHRELVQTMVHTHVEGDDCVEVYVVHGASPKLGRFYSALAGLRGIHLVRRMAIPRHQGILEGPRSR